MKELKLRLLASELRTRSLLTLHKRKADQVPSGPGPVVSLLVAEILLFTSILPAWAEPTDLLRPPITATSARELAEAVRDGGEQTPGERFKVVKTLVKLGRSVGQGDQEAYVRLVYEAEGAFFGNPAAAVKVLTKLNPSGIVEQVRLQKNMAAYQTLRALAEIWKNPTAQRALGEIQRDQALLTELTRPTAQKPSGEAKDGGRRAQGGEEGKLSAEERTLAGRVRRHARRMWEGADPDMKLYARHNPHHFQAQAVLSVLRSLGKTRLTITPALRDALDDAIESVTGTREPLYHRAIRAVVGTWIELDDAERDYFREHPHHLYVKALMTLGETSMRIPPHFNEAVDAAIQTMIDLSNPRTTKVDLSHPASKLAVTYLTEKRKSGTSKARDGGYFSALPESELAQHLNFFYSPYWHDKRPSGYIQTAQEILDVLRNDQPEQLSVEGGEIRWLFTQQGRPHRKITKLPPEEKKVRTGAKRSAEDETAIAKFPVDSPEEGKGSFGIRWISPNWSVMKFLSLLDLSNLTEERIDAFSEALTVAKHFSERARETKVQFLFSEVREEHRKRFESSLNLSDRELLNLYSLFFAVEVDQPGVTYDPPLFPIGGMVNDGGRRATGSVGNKKTRKDLTWDLKHIFGLKTTSVSTVGAMSRHLEGETTFKVITFGISVVPYRQIFISNAVPVSEVLQRMAESPVFSEEERARLQALHAKWEGAPDGGEQTNATFEWGELGRLLAALAKQGPIDFRSVRKPGKGRQKVLVTYDPSEPKPLLKINGDRTATPEDYLGVLLAADLPPAMREAIVASARTSAPHLLAEAPDGGRRAAQDGGAKLFETPSRLRLLPAYFP